MLDKILKRLNRGEVKGAIPLHCDFTQEFLLFPRNFDFKYRFIGKDCVINSFTETYSFPSNFNIEGDYTSEMSKAIKTILKRCEDFYKSEGDNIALIPVENFYNEYNDLEVVYNRLDNTITLRILYTTIE